MSVKRDYFFDTANVFSNLYIPRVNLNVKHVTAKGNFVYNITDDSLYYCDGLRWIPIVTDAENVGGGAEVFKDRTGGVLNFRTLFGSEKLGITQNTNDLTLEVINYREYLGDTRDIVGLTFTHGDPYAYPDITGGGSGLVSLSVVGNTITVTCSLVNPDFSTLTAGDVITCISTANVVSSRTIASVSGNTITVTAAPPTLNNYTGSIMIRPNQTIDLATINELTSVVRYFQILVKGYYIEPTEAFISNSGQVIQFSNCIINCIPNAITAFKFFDVDMGSVISKPISLYFFACSYLKSTGDDLSFSEETVFRCDYFGLYTNRRNGIAVYTSSSVLSNLKLISFNTGGTGIRSLRGGSINISKSLYIIGCDIGINAANSGIASINMISNTTSDIRNCQIGIRADTGRVGVSDGQGVNINSSVGGSEGMRAVSTAMIYNAPESTVVATTPYTPAVSGVFSADAAVIVHS